MLIATTFIWLFLAQMPGDKGWHQTGRFDSQWMCEVFRLNFLTSHPNIVTQPCQRVQMEGV